MSATTTAVISPLQEETRHTYVEVYSRFTPIQKRGMTALLAFCGFSATMSTTSVLAAVPEIVSDFGTTATVVTISNALYLLIMGLSSCLWGPASDIFGRRKIYLCTLVLFCGFSLATALSPTIAVFFAFRAITASQGIAFLILGSSCISDIYHPSERGTSLAWFLAGSMSGYAFGPVIGGAIVTYTSWRVIFWLQTGMSGLSLISIYLFLKETLLPLNRQYRTSELRRTAPRKMVLKLWQWINPLGTVKLYGQRNLLFPILASSALVWNMYSLLTPVRYILNPRLNLANPLQSGLLFFAPGSGYLIGVQAGGRWADFVMKYWTEKRGYRRPEDRLRSSLFFLGILNPGAMVVYGWMIDHRVGGIPVPIICMFLQGFAQTASFVSLNAYMLDVMRHRSGQVSASHYMMRFAIGAAGTTVCLPLIQSIGIGWTSTISAAFLAFTAGLVCWTLVSGESWRESSSAQYTQ